MEGREAVAWFNTRKPKNESAENFYEFGLYEPMETKRARATQRPLGEAEPPLQVTSQLGPARTVGEFLEQIKHTLPAAIKVAEEVDSFHPISIETEAEDANDGTDEVRDGSSSENEKPVGGRLSKLKKQEGASQAAQWDLVARKIHDSVGRLSAKYEGTKSKKNGVDRSRELSDKEGALTAEETHIVGSPYEIVLVHVAGRLHDTRLGERKKCNIPMDTPSEATVTHNHPSGSGPGAKDLLVALLRPGWTMRVATRRGDGRIQLWQFKAMKTLTPAEIADIKAFWDEKYKQKGDTARGRKKALELTLEEYPDIIHVNSRIFP